MSEGKMRMKTTIFVDKHDQKRKKENWMQTILFSNLQCYYSNVEYITLSELISFLGMVADLFSCSSCFYGSCKPSFWLEKKEEQTMEILVSTQNERRNVRVWKTFWTRKCALFEVVNGIHFQKANRDETILYVGRHVLLQSQPLPISFGS